MKKSKRLPLLFFLIVFGVLLIGGGIFAIIRMQINKNNESEYTIPPEYVIEYPDVEKYYNENSTVLEVIPVANSQDVFTEKEATKLLESRGFTEYVITASYSIDGTYIGETEILTSSDKYPMYQTYYVSSKSELWTIMIIDGSLMAYPVSYNLKNTTGVPVAVSESMEILSYDGSTNSFYKTIPNKDAMNIRVVNIIDANSLELLTMEELANG